MHPGHDLHQALGAHRTLRKWVEAGLHSHHRQYECGLQTRTQADEVGLCHDGAQGFRGDSVFVAQPIGQRRLRFGQIPGLAGRGPVAGIVLFFSDWAGKLPVL